MADLTPKQEAFCMAYVETGNASEAYRRAYDASKTKDNVVHVKASELLSNGKVAVRVSQLQAVHQKRHEITVDDLVRELDEARRLALETEAPAAAVSAIMGKGKLLGLIVDRKELTGKDGESIKIEAASTDELVSRISRLASRK